MRGRVIYDGIRYPSPDGTLLQSAVADNMKAFARLLWNSGLSTFLLRELPFSSDFIVQG